MKWNDFISHPPSLIWCHGVVIVHHDTLLIQGLDVEEEEELVVEAEAATINARRHGWQLQNEL